VTGRAGVDVTGLAYDSRRVRSGDLFFQRCRGCGTTGTAVRREAFARGAVAVVAGAPVEAPGRTVVRVGTRIAPWRKRRAGSSASRRARCGSSA